MSQATKSPPLTVTSPSGRDACSACYRCGGAHALSECRFKQVECHFCHKQGHIASVCRQKAKQQHKTQKSGIKTIHKVAGSEETDIPEYSIYNFRFPDSRPLFVELQIHNVLVQMEVDTGATLSIISHHTYDTLWPGKSAPPIKPPDAKLHTYTGERVSVNRAIDVEVVYQSQKATVHLASWAEMVASFPFRLVADAQGAKHSSLFKEGPGKITGTTAKLYMNSDAQPRFCRACPAPFSIRAKVEQEIDRQVKFWSQCNSPSRPHQWYL